MGQARRVQDTVPTNRRRKLTTLHVHHKAQPTSVLSVSQAWREWEEGWAAELGLGGCGKGVGRAPTE